MGSRIDFKENSIATYSTESTVTQEVTSLASTVLEAPFSTAYLRGRTVANILGSVGDCEATTGWMSTAGATFATDSSNKVFGSNSLKLTTDGTSDAAYSEMITKVASGRYYFSSIYLKNGNGTNMRFYLQDDGGVVEGDQIVTSTSSWIRVGAKKLCAATTYFYPTAQINGSSGQYGYFDGVMVVEITADEYNNLTVAQLLAKYPYHADIKGSDKMRVLSVGKNLVNKYALTSGGYINYATGAVAVNASYSYTEYIKVEPNTTYVKTDYTCFQIGVAYYDINKNYISGTIANSYSFTTPANASYIRTATENSNIDTMQIEKGSVATSYEPYKSTSAITPEIGNNVGTVADTYNILTGLKTQNISALTSIATTVYDSLDTTTFTNVDVVKTTAFSLAVAGTTAVDGKTRVFNSSNKELEEVSQANIDLVGSIGKYYYHTDGTIWFLITPDTYANIGDARTGLGTSRILYQLATPILTTYNGKAIVAEPSGTLIVESAVEEYGFYNSGFTISNSGYPITDLKNVWKVSLESGLPMTPISLSTCTIAEGGLSFTSTALAEDDFIWLDYGYVGLSSIPSTTYNYATNLKAQTAQNTTAIANIDKKVESHIAEEDALAEKVKFTPEGGLAIRMINKTGGVSVKGEVVTPYSATAINQAVKKIVVDVPDPIGVIYESGVADGSYMWVVISGIADVYFVGNASLGHIARGFLTADGVSYVTGQVLSEAYPTTPFSDDKHFYEVGHVIEARTGAGLAKVVLHFN